jgi:hypothetical protein
MTVRGTIALLKWCTGSMAVQVQLRSVALPSVQHQEVELDIDIASRTVRG